MKTQIHSESLRTLFLSVFGIAAGILPGVYAKDWEVIEKDGGSFVGAGNIFEFYQFEEKKENPGERRAFLKHPHMEVSLDQLKDPRHIEINRVRFKLIHPMGWDDRRQEVLVHVDDLSKVLDPTLRPQFRGRISEARLIYLSVENPPSGFDRSLLENSLEKGGWNKIDLLDKKTDLRLAIEFAIPKEAEITPALNTRFGMKKRKGKFPPPGLPHRKALHFATAIHSRLLKLDKMRDLSIEGHRVEAVKYPDFPEVRIILSLPEGSLDWKKFYEAIAEALAKVSEMHGKVQAPAK